MKLEADEHTILDCLLDDKVDRFHKYECEGYGEPGEFFLLGHKPAMA